MAGLLLTGIGSIVASEIGKVAQDNMPLIKQVGTNAVINVAKKSFDAFLDHNPNFANFLGHFGVRHFSERRTMTHRGRPRKIAMM